MKNKIKIASRVFKRLGIALLSDFTGTTAATLWPHNSSSINLTNQKDLLSLLGEPTSSDEAFAVQGNHIYSITFDCNNSPEELIEATSSLTKKLKPESKLFLFIIDANPSDLSANKIRAITNKLKLKKVARIYYINGYLDFDNKSDYALKLKNVDSILSECGLPVSLIQTISTENYQYLDDYSSIFRNTSIKNWHFYFVRESLENSIGETDENNVAFHVSMHYESVSVSNHTSFEKKIHVQNKAQAIYDFNGLTNNNDTKKHDSKLIISYSDNTGLISGKNPVLLLNNRPIPLKAIITDTVERPASTKDIFNYGFSLIKRKLNNRNFLQSFKQSGNSTVNSAAINRPNQWKSVLITGWYGTETIGDKAILGEIVHFIKSNSPDCKVTVTTIHPYIFKHTCLEMEELADVEILDIDIAHSSKIIRNMDAVIMGGGPLMETSRMKNVWQIFNEANKQSKARVIFGCGVGPLHTSLLEDITADIIRLTTAGFFRDKESMEYAKKLCTGTELQFACDPAVAYVARWRKRNIGSSGYSKNSTKLITLLRASTKEFKNDHDNNSLENANLAIAKKIALTLDLCNNEKELTASLLHMNAPWIGGDDRLFNRIVEANSKNPEQINVVRKYHTMDDLLHNLKDAGIGIAMRYHGHVFCMAMGIPFLSIDYTGNPGKVNSLVNRINYAEYSEVWESYDADNAKLKIDELYIERESLSNHLLKETEKLTAILFETYRKTFNLVPSQEPVSVETL